MRVAIVYDRINKWGGAERLLLSLNKIFPEAPLYTSVYDQKSAPWAEIFPKVHTSFLQKIPFLRNKHELLAILMPFAFESFNFDDYDLVISVTSESAKGIVTKPGTIHVCYCLTPTRYLWSGYETYFKNHILKIISKPVVNHLKNWDKIAAHRPDNYFSISTEVDKRIKKFYGKDSELIFPPTQKLSEGNNAGKVGKDYYLVVNRLVPYKKNDLVIKVFNKLKKTLYIVGVGSELRKLKSIAKNNIKFLGNVSDEELSDLYKNAKALIMPQEEDYGLVSVESQSWGTPVISFKRSGAVDTIIENVTGIFFDEQNLDSLKRAIEKFEKMSFNKELITSNAENFSEEVFQRKLQRSLVRTLSRGRRRD